VPGAIAGKTVRQREYEQQKLKAVFNAQHQSLFLHGLTKEQVASILENRTLVQGVTVFAPEHSQNGYAQPPTHPFTVKQLHVKSGEYVDSGALLCQLMDYDELYIQGRAFEQDADELVRAAKESWEITATRDDNSQQAEVIKGLRIVYVDNEVEPESRALHFYVALPNKIVHESKSADGHRFLTWQYKPGQRMQLRVPVEQWPDRIVLPVEAVAKEGVEFYVFQQNGEHLDRVPVQVEYQDQFSAVIANDGSVFPGDVVATSGAHQLQMALKNKAGGGVDPHAGHNH
jgi:multidrug efflux pump subunit AcrA (membrane-fusion protein)